MISRSWSKRVVVLATIPWLASSLAAWSAGRSGSISSLAPLSGDQNQLVSSSGEASYRIGFEVPPGRNGAQPTVELDYGSRSPLRGGIAAGWQMPLSRIHVDTTAGRSAGLVYAIDDTRLIPSGDQSSQSGAVYRAHGDTSYSIFEHVPDGTEAGHWTARSPDGSVREFGAAPSSVDLRTDTGAQFGGQARWFLSRSVDARGNEIVYTYATVNGWAHDGSLVNTPVDLRLSSISYGRNVYHPSSTYVAAVDFTYAPSLEMCGTSAVPIGAQFDFRTGIRRYLGASKLVAISSRIFDPATYTWTKRRELDLSYDATAAACYQPHAPMRLLSSAQLTVWDAAGAPLVLPPMTFGYGPLDYDFAPTGGTSSGQPGSGSTLDGEHESFNIADSITADVDGNGTTETMTPATLATGGCYVGNAAVPGFGWENGVPPDVTINGIDQCTGSEQFAVHPANATPQASCGFQRLEHERLVDLSGDGLPDLVTQLSYQGPNYDPSQDPQLENVVNPQHATDYLNCSAAPVQPCHDANGSPAPCLLDPAQLIPGVRAVGLPRWTGALPVSGQGNTCAIMPDMRCGWYVLRMYPNLGNGTFATTPTIVYSPVPLAVADYSSAAGNALLPSVATNHSLIDLDGDGVLDAVYSANDFVGQYSFWRGLGDGTGLFAPQRVDWTMPGSFGIETPAGGQYLDANGHTVSSRPYGSTDPNAWHVHTIGGSSNTLSDINGDGLPDMVHTVATTLPAKVYVYYNTGAGFETQPTLLEGGGALLGYFSETVTVPFVLDPTHDEVIDDGYTVAIRRPMDLDGDGMIDVAAMAAPVSNQYAPNGNPDTSVTAYVNLGDKLVPATMTTARASAWYASLLAITGYHGAGAWVTGSDVVDTDGDGLPETQQLAVDNGTHGCFQGNFANCGHGAPIMEATQQPYRLLTRVDNGLGETSSFAYTSVRDTSVVTITTADVHHRVPSPLVVVKEIDVAVAGAPTATTAFTYQNPRTAPDAFGRTGFRGFEQVTELGPTAESGARRTTIRRTDFSVDPRGRESAVLTLTGATLARLFQRTWIEADTFGSIPSFLEGETRSYTCKPRTEALATAESDCIGQDPIERHVETWQPVHPGDTTVCFGCATNSNTPIAYVRTLDARLSQTGAVQPGDTAKATAYEVHRAVAQWLVLGNDTKVLAAAAAGTFANATVWAHTQIGFDANGYGEPTTIQVEQRPGVFATTALTYDTFGNVSTSMRPNQVALGAAGKSATTTYDALGLEPIASVDELGHRIEQDWDRALGVVTERRGPQQGTTMPRSDTVYDGLGRPVQRSRLADAGGASPTNTIVFTATYSDTVTDHSVLTASRIDYSPATWQQIKTTLDALGRPTAEARLTGTNTWETTTRRYDGTGSLVEVDVPNPAGGTPSTVATTFAYDGLGRVTSEIAPASAPRTTQYAGVYTTTTETPSDGSIGYQKIVGVDGFGRVTTVTEGATTKIITKYAYDPMDRIRHIVDADAIMTDIAFTLGGERSWVQRSGSRLVYDYDLDGNRLAVHHPTPAGVNANDPKWMTTWSYDALDRVAVSVPAVRDMSPADQVRLQANVATVYTYDDPARKNGIGRLTSVTYPFGAITYDYTIEGWRSAETRNLSVSPDGVSLAVSGEVQAVYNAQGAPAMVTYPDDAVSSTTARYITDLQGRAAQLDIGQAGANFQTGIASFVRNSAGYVTGRMGVGNVAEQSYFYDAAGRPYKTYVSAYLHAGDTTKTALAGDGFAYLQNGNIQRWDDRATSRSIAMTYDDLARVMTATAGTDYSAAFTYSNAGNILTANVQSALPGAQVTPRNVTYDRTIGTGDVADPEAIRQLKSTTGSTFASFSYDASSNLRTRTVGGATTSFVYDGYDELRDAKTASSDEIYYYSQAGARILTYRAAATGRPASLRHRFDGTEVIVDTTGATTTTTDVGFGGLPAVRVTNHDVTAMETLYHGLLGNLVAVLDKTRVMRARYAYGPYGEILFADGPETTAFDHTYEDKARDASTGLSYFGRRYYDPLTTTWTQPDPLYRFVPDRAALAPRKMALFTYVLDNPLRYVDPDGLDTKPQAGPQGGTAPQLGAGWLRPDAPYSSSFGGAADTPVEHGPKDTLEQVLDYALSLAAMAIRDLEKAMATLDGLLTGMVDQIAMASTNMDVMLNPIGVWIVKVAGPQAAKEFHDLQYAPNPNLPPPPHVDQGTPPDPATYTGNIFWWNCTGPACGEWKQRATWLDFLRRLEPYQHESPHVDPEKIEIWNPPPPPPSIIQGPAPE